MTEQSQGAPVLTIEQQLTGEEYAQAFLLYEYSLSPLYRPKVRAGLCLCAAVLLGSLVPYYSTQFATVYLPAAAILFCLALALYCWRELPRRHRGNALQRFQCSQLLGLPSS